MFKSIVYLISNFILTLYGLIVKSFPNISLLEQVYARSIIFTIISIFSVIGWDGFLTKIPHLLNIAIQPITLLLSIVNFISIYGVYLSFERLGIGITQSIFYSWPIFYYILTQTPFTIQETIVLIITFACILLISPLNGDMSLNKQTTIGFLGVLASLITHIYIFYYMKMNTPNINEYLFSQYIFVFLGLSIYYIYKKIKENYTIDFKKQLPILVFNIILGYLAFYLQFYSITSLNPFVLSLLTFLSIVIGVLIDMAFFKKHLQIKQWLGVFGIIVLNYFFYKI
jgi:drug/metabolite transporter (DMT)-like permease